MDLNIRKMTNHPPSPAVWLKKILTLAGVWHSDVLYDNTQITWYKITMFMYKNVLFTRVSIVVQVQERNGRHDDGRDGRR